ncbi:hypothetical protein OH76DRAFT_1489460 [Lentinus brumalis]|uniref:Uncharacterized protein n=1 Tax=Lentinus brumalis TaxID=2498619 RepID=A0A371CMH1_9APHY|nr:hypothetical protein OH76DRAFT_1489460 [Polyporus brumalis]
MDPTPSYHDLAAWEDLNLLIPEAGAVEDPDDPRHLDPRQPPPELVVLDQSIQELEERLADLKAQRAKLLDERALIGRLPPELLSRIFELGVGESFDLLPTLNLVSAKWRAVALSTPPLWSYIVLDADWAWRIPAFLGRMRVYLQRSQASKLFIDLDFRQFENPANVEAVMAEAEPHLWRCYSFNVSVIDWPRLRQVQEHASGLGPTLEDLYLCIDSSESETHEPFSFLTQPCPRLGYVVLEHAPLDCIQVPLPSLRHLHLLRDHRCHSSARISYPFHELVATVTKSPLKCLKLRSALFALDASEEVFKASPCPTELRDLKDLTFDVVDSGSITLFFEATILPALEILSVNSGEDLQWLRRISLTPSHFPSLRLLDLRNCNFSGPALVPLVRALHHLPQITGLGISSPSTGVVGTRIFDMLAAGPDILGRWLLPRLEALSLQNCVDISGHELHRVVLARRGAAALEVANITYLKVSQCYSLDPEVLERLISLVDTVRSL